VALLPYINLLLLPAFVIGAGVAVRSAGKSRPHALELKDGAKLGFISTFVGAMAAAILVDIIWALFDYQLWQKQNTDVMLAAFRTFASPQTIDAMSTAFEQNASKPFAWYIIIIQAVSNVIMCGIFGTFTGVISAAIVRRRIDRGI
jgi:hypothetical protein